MKAQQLIDLHEATANLYHVTSLWSAVQIAKDNEFALTFAPATPADSKSKKRAFYMSCSRLPFGGYSMGYTYHKNTAATLQLDGIKLSQRYRIVPVAYWGSDYDKLEFDKRRRYDENEDRIESDQPYIEDAIRYIKCCHVYVPVEHMNNDFEHGHLIELSKVKLFKVLYYTDFAAFKLLDTRRASTELPEGRPHLAVPEPYTRHGSDGTFEDVKKTVAWLEHPEDPANRDYFDKRAHYHDFINACRCDLHNIRSYKTHESQALLAQFAKLLSKYGNSVKKAIDNAQEISRKTFWR